MVSAKEAVLDLDKAAVVEGVAAMHALLARVPVGASLPAEETYAPALAAARPG